LLIKEGKPSDEELQDVWTKIYDEFIKEIGLSSEFIALLKKKEKLHSLRCKYIISRKRVFLTQIEILEDSIKRTEEREFVDRFRENVVEIERFMKRGINAQEITVAQYHSYLKRMSNG